VPYIYSPEEMRALLAGVEQVCAHKKCPIDAVTLRTLLLVLWGTGLRVSEALHLTVMDVDLPLALLTVSDTKFFKTRLVPIDPQLAKALATYAKSRIRRPISESEVSFFFTTHQGTSLTHTFVERYFRKLCKSVGIARQDGARYQPRLHDFRHTFATNRVLSWYQDGADVQRLLPSLSTYIGHGTLAATQRYLTATPEVLREASNRFEQYALEVNHD
jgi:site-specific recombinase XerD